MNDHLTVPDRITTDIACEQEADRATSRRWHDLRQTIKERPPWDFYRLRLALIAFPAFYFILAVIVGGVLGASIEWVWQILSGPLCVAFLILLAKLPVYLFVRIVRTKDRSKDVFLGRANHALARTGSVLIKEPGRPTLNQEHVTEDSRHKIRGCESSGETDDGCF
jgi:hypothetical protein